MRVLAGDIYKRMYKIVIMMNGVCSGKTIRFSSNL